VLEIQKTVSLFISAVCKGIFPKNHWYVAAWGNELKHELLARKICNQSIILFRKRDGTPVALHDRCWHRYAPLSTGTLQDDQVTCGYHGLVFNSDGICTHLPNQKQIPRTACVRSFPVVERHGFVWIWPGDPEKVDELLIPDVHWNNDPSWRGDGGIVHMKCDYRLLIDNLMDLTHETYVHPSSIGDERLPAAPIETDSDEHSVTVTRWIEDHQPAPFWKSAIVNALERDDNCDRWQVITFLPPSCITLDVGVAIAGTGARDGNRSQGVNGYVINAITPETDRSTFYFWNFVRNFDLENKELTQKLHDMNYNIFQEDLAMLESQQKRIDESSEVRLATLNIDAGSKRARMILDRLISDQN
jgi:vanillate O-demethylase monooxygenase subunit